MSGPGLCKGSSPRMRMGEVGGRERGRGRLFQEVHLGKGRTVPRKWGCGHKTVSWGTEQMPRGTDGSRVIPVGHCGWLRLCSQVPTVTKPQATAHGHTGLPVLQQKSGEAAGLARMPGLRRGHPQVHTVKSERALATVSAAWHLYSAQRELNRICFILQY